MKAVHPRTTTGVHRQLWSMNCARYDIGMVKYRDGRSYWQQAGFVTVFNAGDLLPELARQNSRNENIFVRPEVSLDRAIILVDDVEEYDVEKLRDMGLEPCCVVETSPKNLQCWIDFGGTMPVMERKILARRIAEVVEGDLRSADAIHYGRLAGFTNRKESHLGEGSNGGFPFVLCRFAERLICSKALAGRQWAQERAQEVARATKQKNAVAHTSKDVSRLRNDFRRYCDYWTRNPNHARRTDGSDDLSTRDYAVVGRLLHDGYAAESIMIVLAEDATRKKKPMDYAKRTVEAAVARA